MAGITSLVWPTAGEPVAGEVEQLTRAVSRSPRDIQLRNDLIVARFLLAQQEDEPAELVRALNDAQEAYEIDPSVPEVLFNRALILERLFLRDRAIAAWERYLEVDFGTDWAREAQHHLDRLRQIPIPELWKQRLPELDATAATGDQKRVLQIVVLSPQQAREHALEDLLGMWGELQEKGRAEEAALRLREARALGQALRESTEDATVEATVRAIDRAATDPAQDDLLKGLARGHRAYRDAMPLSRNQLIEKAEPLLREAMRGLDQGGSPTALWALLALGSTYAAQSRYEEASQIYSSIQNRAQSVPSPILAGRAEWGLGHVALRQGHFSEALHHFEAAAAAFASRGELEGLGFMHERLAENLRFLGQSNAAWKYRYQAASELWPYRDSIRLHTLLWEAGWAAVEDGCPKAGLLIQEEDVQVAARTGQPQWLAEARIWQSKIHLALGSPQAALAALAEAFRGTAQSKGEWVRQRVGIDAMYVEGEARRRLDPEAALSPISQALQFYSDGKLYLDLIGAYLSRARAYLSAGRLEEAETDLLAAIELFEGQRAKVSDDSSRLSYSEAAQGLFDEMIFLKAERRGDHEGAFAMSERARTVPLSTAPDSSAAARPALEAIGRIPDNVVLIEYAIAHERLFTWVLRRDQVDFVSQKIQPEELAGLVRRLVAGIQSREPKRLLDKDSERLHELLIPRQLAIPTGSKFYFVPDKILHEVPFAALKDPIRRKYLIEDHEVRILPSVSLYLALEGRRAWRPGLVPSALLIGATEWDQKLFESLDSLSAVPHEIEEIREIYGNPRVIIGRDSTKARFLEELDTTEILQVAGHAVFNPRHSERSYFVLAPSGEDTGVLFASEIAGRRFEKLRLVVLAACSTLGPLDSRTSGLAGLARPFLDGGVSAVVGTLWNVNDDAAERLMMGFHSRYLKTGDAAGALREAQLSMLRSSDSFLRSPSAWAGYQVVGAGE
ncbi:MAG TPA: CHAT domain-containing protein [Thermoanaerobaculia bacterium]|jgi:CHAT domain-containing protein|nr:CHAT domain-containing protein [Thermoanaerobaculia bacterium]